MDASVALAPRKIKIRAACGVGGKPFHSAPPQKHYTKRIKVNM